jgi:MFS family permease
MNMRPRLNISWLNRASGWQFTLFATLAAFSTYACMYAFRKPYTATTFDVAALGGMQYKTVLVIAQILGYTLSKFLGIKYISEMGRNRRGLAILVLIGIAELALIGLGLVPHPYNFVFLFLNGLPLGMIWGLVFSYLEGRRLTEILGAGLSVSFVVSSGFVKSVGKAVLDSGVDEFWMPAVTGSIFVVPLIISVWALDQVPPPTMEDEASRTKRLPMQAAERRGFVRRFGPGLALLVLVYMLLTAFRDFRDNFMAEIFKELGMTKPETFATTEMYVALALLGIIGITVLIRNNWLAFAFNHVLIVLGFGLVGVATWAFGAGLISPVAWMVLTGIGGYMGYIPFNCILFERLIATFKAVGNAGFLIYLADALGYTAAVGVMVYRDFFAVDLSWVRFFTLVSWLMVGLGTLLTVGALLYFARKRRLMNDSPSRSDSPH